MKLITPPPGAIAEVLDFRTVHSKTYDFGQGKRRLIHRVGHVHYPSPTTQQLEEVDTALVALGGNRLGITQAWYDLSITGRIGGNTPVTLTYTGKRGGTVDITLLEINDTPIANLSLNTRPQRLDDDKLLWVDLVPGLDVWIALRPANIEIYKRVKSASAPTRLTWRIVDSPGSPVSVQQRSIGRDEQLREARILTTITPEPDPAPGRRSYLYREEFTGETLVENHVTRVKEIRPASETVYPVVIDVQVLEDIVANADDINDRVFYDDIQDIDFIICLESGASASKEPGFRFQSVAVPQGATINDPTTLSFVVASAPVAGSAVFYGYDTDSAAAWSATVRPENVTPTTATGSVTLATTGAKTVDIKTVVQEIVNRAGWATGGHMSFFAKWQGMGTGTSITIHSYNYAPASSADLEINYTAGGTTFPQPKLFLLLGVGA